MQSIEIDPELNRLALAEAAQQYPEFAGHALRVIARPFSSGPGNYSEMALGSPETLGNIGRRRDFIVS
jgi:hypothetical protein